MRSWALRQQRSSLSYTHSYLFDEPLGYAVAVAGFRFQLLNGFTIPFPLSVVFWPLSLIEWYIRYSVTSDAPPA